MNIATWIRGLALLLVLLMVSGCGVLSSISDASKSLEVYELRVPSSVPVARGGPIGRNVTVELPTTSGALETERIMIRPSPLQAQYLPGVRWSDPAPVMVQTLMLRTFEATGGLRYVGRTPLGLSGDYAVVSELVDFHAVLEPDGKTATVRLTLIARLVREQDASIIATRRFTASAKTGSTETPTLVKGFDAASAILLTDLANWLLGALGVPRSAS